MAGEIVNTIQPAISEFFLQPLGLLGLLALIPLIIFYLVRRKPETEIMPAMMFFMKDKKSGKAHTALRTLMRNFILLFHILMVLGFAAALAHPFFEAPTTNSNTVIVFDTSASMSNDLEDARSFVESNTGADNTLIIVDDEIQVASEGVSGRQVMNEINNLETTDVKTDISNGIELASDYQGPVIIASDLDQTTSQKSSAEVIENLRNNDRTVKLMETQEENSWGIIDVRPSRTNSSVDIKNFMDKDAEIELRKGDTSTKINIEAETVETINIETDPGRTTITLEEDSFSPDNEAYISLPEQTNHKVVFISEGNPYFEKALELIDFVDIEVVEPPVDKKLNADIYVIGETNRILTDTVNDIESNVNKGDSMIVFGHQGVFDLGLNSLPAEGSGSYENSTVTIREPQQISLGNTQIIESEKTEGESYASPENALISSSYGDGKVFFYNIKDSEFRTNFLYPVFWKGILQELVDRPTVQELNIQTGETLEVAEITTPEGETLSGEVKIEQTGYYETETRTYAANLESEDESYSEKVELSSNNLETQLEERNVQNLAILLITLLLLGELGYLRHIGEI